LKAHRDAVYSEMHQEVYREVDEQVYQADQESTEAAYRERALMKSTGWSPNQTLIDDSWVKQHLEVNAT